MVSEGSGWMIKLINNHYLNIVKYQPMKGSSYINLPNELCNSAKGLINLRTVPTIVIAHTFCASRDTRISYR